MPTPALGNESNDSGYPLPLAIAQETNSQIATLTPFEPVTPQSPEINADRQAEADSANAPQSEGTASAGQAEPQAVAVIGAQAPAIPATAITEETETAESEYWTPYYGFGGLILLLGALALFIYRRRHVG
jgi:hypothetical protein